MAYKLRYSDYSTTDTGPPDPERWVGPPGPMGPPGPVAAGGPFLPLSGGTVTGATTFVGSTDASHPFMFAHHSIAGTMPTGPLAAAYMFNIDNDSADATNAQGGGATGAYFGNAISAGAKGGRTGQGVLLFQSGATDCADGQYYVATGAFSYASHTAGGSPGAPKGALFASNIGATLETGAGNWHSCIGMEIDVGVQTSCTAQFKIGLLVVQFASDAVRGSLEDAAISIGNQNGPAPGWGTGLEFGSYTGWWPFTGTSTLIGTKASGIGGGPAMNAGWGIDLSAVTFGNGLLNGPGFSINGAGKITAATGLALGSAAASSNVSVARHIDLFAGLIGLCVDPGGGLSIVGYTAGTNVYTNGTRVATFSAAGLDSTAIGASFPATGAFTTISATGAATFTSTTQTGAQSLPLPAAKTGTAYTVAATDCSLVLAPTATFTLTLPAASASTGRIIRLKLTAAFAVNSASSNIVQLVGGAATAAIMPATSGKFCQLQSDGTAWQIMTAN